MSTKHSTKVHAIPTQVLTLPVSKENCWDMFKIRGNAYCVFKDVDDKYYTAYFDISQLDKPKKTIKIYVSNDSYGGYRRALEARVDKLLFAYFYNTYDVFLNIENLNNCLEIIGTKRKTYFDMVQSCGTDFTYEKPYIEFYHQPKLKNKSIDIRKKYADVNTLTLTIDELDNNLFLSIQKLAIDKFKVIESTGIKNGETHPCEIIEKIPVELSNGKLSFSNTISFRIENSHSRSVPHIKMKAGDYFEDCLSSYHMKSVYKNARTTKQVEKVLDEFLEYVKIVPKINSPWLFY